jgi:hypothetical protein
VLWTSFKAAPLVCSITRPAGLGLDGQFKQSGPLWRSFLPQIYQDDDLILVEFEIELGVILDFCFFVAVETLSSTGKRL